jgi:hypothetical protein
MANINVTDYTPKFDDETDDNTYVAVPQSDGSIKYFMGNLARVGELMHIIIDNPGQYHKSAVIGVKILDEAGEEVENNGGAKFFVKTGKKGRILDAFAMPEAEGSNFHLLLSPNNTSLPVKFTVENSEHQFVEATGHVNVYLGTWDDTITASEVEYHNKQQAELMERRIRLYKPSLRDRRIGVAPPEGNPIPKKFRGTGDGRETRL